MQAASGASPPQEPLKNLDLNQACDSSVRCAMHNMCSGVGSCYLALEQNALGPYQHVSLQCCTSSLGKFKARQERKTHCAACAISQSANGQIEKCENVVQRRGSLIMEAALSNAQTLFDKTVSSVW